MQLRLRSATRDASAPSPRLRRALHRFARACGCALLWPAVAFAQTQPSVPAAQPLVQWTPGSGVPEWTAVGQIVVHSGLLYVTQPQDHVILVLDAKGTLLRRIGRKGAGPGEFRSIGALGMKGDTLWAHDYILRRVTFFALTGVVRRTTVLEVPPIEGLSPPTVAGMSESGDVVLLFATTPGDPSSERMPVKVFRRDGSLREITSVRAPSGATRVPPSGMYVNGEYQRFFGGGGVVMVDNRTISSFDAASNGRVTQQDFAYDGARGASRQFSLPVVRVPAALAARLQGEILQRLTKVARSADVARSLMPVAFPMPSTFPVLLGAARLPSGDLLVQTPSSNETLVVWQVLNRAGTMRPVFTTERAFRPMGMGGGRLWGTVQDADGLDVIVAYALPFG